jgi:hypothetical protein
MNAPTMRFKQRNGLISKVELTLFPDYAEYYFVSGRGKSTGYNVKYELLPNEFYYRTDRPRDTYVLLPMVSMAAITLVELWSRVFVDAYQIIGLSAVVGTILCGIGYGLRRLFKRSCTSLPTAAGTIMIVQNGKHDRMIGELQTRRAAALKRQVFINKSTPPWLEIKKFKWLKDEGIITEDELTAYREMILSHGDIIAGEAPVKERVLN